VNINESREAISALRARGEWVGNYYPESSLTLDGEFTVNDLLALVAWMEAEDIADPGKPKG